MIKQEGMEMCLNFISMWPPNGNWDRKALGFYLTVKWCGAELISFFGNARNRKPFEIKFENLDNYRKPFQGIRVFSGMGIFEYNKAYK